MRSIVRTGIAGIIAVLAGMPTARAVDQGVTLRVGNNSVIELDREFETVIIGNPDIVDVHSGGDRLVVLEPLRLGASNLVFVDKDHVAIANVRVFVCNVVRSAFRQGPDCD
jgi:Flp pilus assembly secretin CpaC